MRMFVGVFLAASMMATLTVPAVAAPSEESPLAAVLKRLDSLEQENRTLRRRIQVIEASKQPGAHPALLAKPTVEPTSAVSTLRAARESYAAVPSAMHDWTGIYLGLHAGAALVQNDWSSLGIICFNGLFCPDPDLPAATGSALGAGMLGGFQAGYNSQFERWLIGVHGQYSFANADAEAHSNRQDAFLQGGESWTGNGTETLSTRIVGLGAVGLRLGYTPDWLDGLLVFGTAGAAYARTRISESYGLQYSRCNLRPVLCRNDPFSGSALGATDSVGWFAGFGGELALTRDISASLDYQWFDFGSQTVTLGGTQCRFLSGTCADWNRTADLAQKVQVLKFGVNYHLH